MYYRACVCKEGTLHKRLYFHPQLGSRSWPIKFSYLTPWPCRKSGLDPWLLSINHAHQSPGETLTVLKLPPIPSLTAWPASKFRLDHLTSLWPRSRVVEYSCLCSVPPPPPLVCNCKTSIKPCSYCLAALTGTSSFLLSHLYVTWNYEEEKTESSPSARTKVLTLHKLC